MKRFIQLLVSLSALCIALSLQVQGQTYYDFVMGSTSVPYTHSGAIIRTIDPQRAVAYYSSGRTHKLAVIDMNGTITETEYPEEILINDIRVVGNDIFLCGWDTINYYGVLGYASVTSILSSTPSIDFQKINLGTDITLFIPWRLAAYIDNSGMFRMVTIGEMYYSSLSTVPPWFYPCSNSYYLGCHTFFVLECTYSAGTFSPVGCKFLCDSNRYERADDVVLTDNWLAIITQYPDKNKLIIHRCNKDNVVGTLDTYHSYTVPNYEGMYHCCKMQGDTIALVAQYQPSWTTTYETHMRTVDLASLIMTNATSYPLLAKAVPEEIVYLPEYATLVLLQCQLFPSSVFHYAYISLKPYTTPPYNADLIYEQGDNPFHSIDLLCHKYIVAAGGNYWIENNVMSINTSTECYIVDQQPILPLSTASHAMDTYPYYSQSFSLVPIFVNESFNSPALLIPCRIF